VDTNLPGYRAAGRVAVLVRVRAGRAARPDDGFSNSAAASRTQFCARAARQGYRWGQPTAPLLEALSDGAPAADAFDLIILADVVFNHNQHQQLLQTCDACLTRDGTGEVRHPHSGSRCLAGSLTRAEAVD